MKTIAKLLCIIPSLTVGLLTTSCGPTSTSSNNTSVPVELATRAGFQPVTASTPAQKKLLHSLPADKVSLTTHKGKQYYILPEPASNRALVGGPKQYQRYQELVTAGKMSNASVQGDIIAQATEGNDWGNWSGWGDGSGLAW